MKKLMVFVIFALLATSGIAIAARDHRGAPDFVPQLSEDKLTKIEFIRYAPGFAKNKPCDYDEVCDVDEGGWCSDCRGDGEVGEEPTDSGCYDFLAGSKPRWAWVEDYYYNSDDLRASSMWATSVWDASTSTRVFGNAYSGSMPWGVYDYVNSISYGDYPESGVIGVAAIWYKGKNIYEYDIMFDTDYFPNSNSIDFNTVVLHEFGHAAGMGDLYDTVCSNEVMYGYYMGVKHDLRTGDIAGMHKLYGV